MKRQASVSVERVQTEARNWHQYYEADQNGYAIRRINIGQIYGPPIKFSPCNWLWPLRAEVDGRQFEFELVHHSGERYGDKGGSLGELHLFHNCEPAMTDLEAVAEFLLEQLENAWVCDS